MIHAQQIVLLSKLKLTISTSMFTFYTSYCFYVHIHLFKKLPLFTFIAISESRMSGLWAFEAIPTRMPPGTNISKLDCTCVYFNIFTPGLGWCNLTRYVITTTVWFTSTTVTTNSTNPPGNGLSPVTAALIGSEFRFLVSHLIETLYFGTWHKQSCHV